MLAEAGAAVTSELLLLPVLSAITTAFVHFDDPASSRSLTELGRMDEAEQELVRAIDLDQPGSV